MADLQTLQQQLARLDAAIANPNQRISDNGMSVEKRSLADLERQRRLVLDQIAVLQAGCAPSRIVHVLPGKGY